ncbi:glycoside hydrolase family 5 protein [Neorhizobium galegae]|nr:glycoside hydrolase family 5 protein [Neorhizobium galegae]
MKQRSPKIDRGVSRLLGVLVSLAVAAGAAEAKTACLRGVNLAGAEFGSLGDEYGKGYIYPTKETIDYFAGKGFNTVRLPFLWERLQPQLYKGFDSAEPRAAARYGPADPGRRHGGHSRSA